MKAQNKVRQLPSGQWAVFTSKVSYWIDSVRETQKEAEIYYWEQRGRDAQNIIDKCDKELQRLGAYNHNDPHGYLA